MQQQSIMNPSPIQQTPKMKQSMKPYKIQNKQVLRFAKQRYSNFFNQMIRFSSYNSSFEKRTFEEVLNELEPKSNINPTKKAQIIHIRKCSENAEKLSKKSTPAMFYKIRIKSSNRNSKSPQEVKNDYCTPLNHHQPELEDNSLANTIQRLRIQKENKRNILKHRKITEDKKTDKMKDSKFEISTKELGSSTGQLFWGNRRMQVIVKVLDQQKPKNQNKRCRTHHKQKNQSQITNSTSYLKYSQLQIEKAEDSEFLKNFATLKLNSRITLSNQSKHFFIQQQQPKICKIKRKSKSLDQDLRKYLEKTSIQTTNSQKVSYINNKLNQKKNSQRISKKKSKHIQFFQQIHEL